MGNLTKEINNYLQSQPEGFKYVSGENKKNKNAEHLSDVFIFMCEEEIKKLKPGQDKERIEELESEISEVENFKKKLKKNKKEKNK